MAARLVVLFEKWIGSLSVIDGCSVPFRVFRGEFFRSRRTRSLRLPVLTRCPAVRCVLEGGTVGHFGAKSQLPESELHLILYFAATWPNHARRLRLMVMSKNCAWDSGTWDSGSSKKR